MLDNNSKSATMPKAITYKQSTKSSYETMHTLITWKGAFKGP